jgi:Fe-S-cluster-containing dehydrogenase component
MLDFLVDHRFINGTRAMAINTDRCVNCDDCVRACAAAHDNNPRFIRHGLAHHNLMIANACMHCTDPVCLIGCPTGAIHRDIETGCVLIDDGVCVGCETCANACPYDNIRMVEIRDSNGAFLVDAEGVPILRATKCDFCAGQLGGPACQRACPHDALIRVDIRNTDALVDWLA